MPLKESEPHLQHLLAAEGMDLILIARRPEPLEQLADSLKNKYDVNILCITADLSENDVIHYIEESLNGREINILVYNAALSYIGPFIENSVENHSKAARVNMITPLNMVHFYGSENACEK